MLTRNIFLMTKNTKQLTTLYNDRCKQLSTHSITS